MEGHLQTEERWILRDCSPLRCLQVPPSASTVLDAQMLHLSAMRHRYSTVIVFEHSPHFSTVQYCSTWTGPQRVHPTNDRGSVCGGRLRLSGKLDRRTDGHTHDVSLAHYTRCYAIRLIQSSIVFSTGIATWSWY